MNSAELRLDKIIASYPEGVRMLLFNLDIKEKPSVEVLKNVHLEHGQEFSKALVELREQLNFAPVQSITALNPPFSNPVTFDDPDLSDGSEYRIGYDGGINPNSSFVDNEPFMQERDRAKVGNLITASKSYDPLLSKGPGQSAVNFNPRLEGEFETLDFKAPLKFSPYPKGKVSSDIAIGTKTLEKEKKQSDAEILRQNNMLNVNPIPATVPEMEEIFEAALGAIVPREQNDTIMDTGCQCGGECEECKEKVTKKSNKIFTWIGIILVLAIASGIAVNLAKGGNE